MTRAVGSQALSSESIGVQPWMALPGTRAVFAALEARGYPGCARFVGGCVRNAVMGKPIDDIDIATTLTPDLIIDALEQAGLRAIPTGVDHGTITALSGGRPYEITTLRKDVSTDGRRAVVAFTQDWGQGVERRDFRFNALYADLEGRLYDPTGEGVNDAREGRVVFVGDPMTRIREDYLRILRFFRFQAWYGKGEADQKALAACKALKGMVSGRAAERTQKEIMKLLASEDPRPALRLMAATGVLGSILPFVKSLARFDSLLAIETEQLFENDPDLRLASLIPDDPKVAEQMSERLRLPNNVKDRLIDAVGKSPRIVIDHHVPTEEPAGEIVLDDTAACATGELLFDFATALNLEITPAIAEALARQSAALRPDQKQFWRDLARALEKQGKVEEAQQAMGRG